MLYLLVVVLTVEVVADVDGTLRGCSGCAGSAESVSEAPKRNCASVASITVRIQSHVGFKRFSTYILKELIEIVRSYRQLSNA